MNVLLTGIKGFVGSELDRVLRRENAISVVGIDADNYDDFLKDFCSVNFTDYDYVIHCGAIADSTEKSNILWEMNYKASVRIARECEDANTNLIFISSAASITPTTPYGWSKHCAEFYMQQKVVGPNLCILRPFNIWGFDENKDNDKKSIVGKIINNKLPYIYKGCKRDFIYVSDVVSAIQSVVHDWTPGVFSLGTTKATNIDKLVNTLYAEADMKSSIPVVKCPPDIQVSLVAEERDLLPDWEATPIDEHFLALSKYLKEKNKKSVYQDMFTEAGGVQ